MNYTWVLYLLRKCFKCIYGEVIEIAGRGKRFLIFLVAVVIINLKFYIVLCGEREVHSPQMTFVDLYNDKIRDNHSYHSCHSYLSSIKTTKSDIITVSIIYFCNKTSTIWPLLLHSCIWVTWNIDMQHHYYCTLIEFTDKI